MMYEVKDYYENPFGETVYVADSIEDAVDFCQEYDEDTDGENNLIIITPDGKRVDPRVIAL